MLAFLCDSRRYTAELARRYENIAVRLCERVASLGFAVAEVERLDVVSQSHE